MYSISGRCIFHMDHYCPWMSNCVGYYNYRYFVLFLFWLFVGSIYVISITISPLLSIPSNQRWYWRKWVIKYLSCWWFHFIITESHRSKNGFFFSRRSGLFIFYFFIFFSLPLVFLLQLIAYIFLFMSPFIFRWHIDFISKLISFFLLSW